MAGSCKHGNEHSVFTFSFSRKTLLMKLVIYKIKVFVEVWLFGNYYYSSHSEYTFGLSCTHFDASVIDQSKFSFPMAILMSTNAQKIHYKVSFII